MRRMLSGKEIGYIIIASIVIGVGLGIRNLSKIIILVPITLIVILINILFKKMAAYYLDTETEINLWEFKRYGFEPHKYFEKPIKIGVFAPLVTAVLSFGYFIWMGVLTTDVKASIHRSAKRFNLYSFSEVSEWHMAIIVSAGIFANLLFSIIGYLVGFTDFATINIYYAFFNIIPFSDLDGNKLFFGSPVFWAFTSIITLIGLGYVFFLI